MLFNKNNQGSEELYKITGTFKASTKFEVVENDILDAIANLRPLLGEVLDEADRLYQDGSDSELVRLVQRAVATKALCYFAKNTGLSHGETGRKLKVDENEKIPFEWMIDRDDRDLVERHYRALDQVLRYLDENDLESWKGSATAKSRANLFLKSFADFEDVYPVNGSLYTYYKLIPLLSEAEARLGSLLGTDDFPHIMETNVYIVVSALAEALGRWSLSIFPLEISRQFSPSYQGNNEKQLTTLEEIERTKHNFKKTARAAYNVIAFEVNKVNPAAERTLIPKADKKNKFFTV